MICIKDISIVDGISKTPYRGYILIDKGRVVEIGRELDIYSENIVIIEGEGLHILPGLVDMHCHLREPGYEYKEDIESGTKSAVAGGFTSISPMANTNPPIDNEGMVNFVKSRARTVGVVKVYPIATITKGLKGKEITEIGELCEAGAVGISDDGMPVVDSNVMKLALQYSKMFNMLVISHSEDLNLVADGVMNEGYMCTRGGVELIRQAKHERVPITCETAPHYFSATDEWVEGYDTNTKVNPPLRTADDVEAIKEGLKDGTIDVIATDHAPHHMDEKNIEYNLAAFGISGFETAFSLAYTNLVEKGILSLATLVEKMSSNPASILDIEGGKIEEGSTADMTIVDLNREYVVDVENFYSKGKNNPFNGKKLKGKVLYTIVDGKIVYERGEIL